MWGLGFSAKVQSWVLVFTKQKWETWFEEPSAADTEDLCDPLTAINVLGNEHLTDIYCSALGSISSTTKPNIH